MVTKIPYYVLVGAAEETQVGDQVYDESVDKWKPLEVAEDSFVFPGEIVRRINPVLNARTNIIRAEVANFRKELVEKVCELIDLVLSEKPEGYRLEVDGYLPLDGVGYVLRAIEKDYVALRSCDRDDDVSLAVDGLDVLILLGLHHALIRFYVGGNRV